MNLILISFTLKKFSFLKTNFNSPISSLFSIRTEKEKIIPENHQTADKTDGPVNIWWMQVRFLQMLQHNLHSRPAIAYILYFLSLNLIIANVAYWNKKKVA